MIEILEIVPLNKNKCQIHTDNGVAFVVYKGDLPKNDFFCGAMIAKNKMEMFFSEVLLPRAKMRGMYLLQAREYTVFSLYTKLLQDGYPKVVADQAINYFETNHYVDDSRYTKAFLRTYSKNKSINEMKKILRQKGVSQECILSSLNDVEADGDLECEADVIKRYLQKKKYNSREATLQERNKIFSYLMNKGFSYDNVKSCMENER